jgi:hypothetical protein
MSDIRSSDEELKGKKVSIQWDPGQDIPSVFANQLFISHAGRKEFHYIWSINQVFSDTSTSSHHLELHDKSISSSSDLDYTQSTPFQLMKISEAVLAKEWDTPEEDELWAHL